MKQSRAERRESPRTEITSADALAMLESALWYYRRAGGTVRMGNSGSQEQTALLALPGVRVCKKCAHLTLFEQMVGDVCGTCAEKALG